MMLPAGFLLAMGMGVLPAADITVRPVQDSTTVLRNPAMGFVFYSDLEYGCDFIFNTPNPRLARYADIAYFRTTWARLEPTEGRYLWNEPKVKALIQGLKDKHVGMAFRVMVQDISGTPAWVLKVDAPEGDDRSGAGTRGMGERVR